MYLGPGASDSDSAEFDPQTGTGRKIIKPKQKKKPPKKKPLPNLTNLHDGTHVAIEEYKSKLDQFCDFTTLIGFRLLHSRNPPLLRVISLVVMVFSCIFIYFQIRDAFRRYHTQMNTLVAFASEDENVPIEQPGILICITNQQHGLRKSSGSIDFRNLLYSYLLKEFDSSHVENLKSEIAEMSAYFNSSAYLNHSISVPPARFFPQIAFLLHSELNPLHNHSLDSPAAASFGEYQRERVKKADACFSNDECRHRRAKELFDEFMRRQSDYFSYVDAATYREKDVILSSSFINNDTMTWSPYWSVDYGPCLLGELKTRDVYSRREVFTDKFDYVIFIINTIVNPTYQSRGDMGQVLMFLTRDGQPVNPLEVYQGMTLDIKISGSTEKTRVGCQDKLPLNCVDPLSHRTYSQSTCRWCIDAVRNACPCANPDCYLGTDVLGFEKNCSLIELLECSQRQRERFKESKNPTATNKIVVGGKEIDACREPCNSFSWDISYTSEAVTTEMLDLGVQEMEDKLLPRYIRALEKMNEFLFFGRSPITTKRWTHSLLWKARTRLAERVLADYHEFVTHIYQLAYGKDYRLPLAYQEDSIESRDSPSVMALTEMRGQLELCENASSKSGINALVKDFAGVFMAHFKKSSFMEVQSRSFSDSFQQSYCRIKFYPCPISITEDNCERLLRTNGVMDDNWRIFRELYNRGTYIDMSLELAATLNASTPNPLAVIQFYAQYKGSMTALEETIMKLGQVAQHLLDALERNNHSAGDACLNEKKAIIEKIMATRVMATVNGTNKWLAGFKKYLRDFKSLHLIENYTKTNMILLSLDYQAMTKRVIRYDIDYNFLEFMSEVGGILGLYFGLTIITVYEMVVFLMIDREPHEGGRQQKEQPFSRRVIYKRDKTFKTDQAIPTIF